jgi:acyl-coenzyme A thioesterase PaaI-like protein
MANAQAAVTQIAFFRAIPWCAALLSQPGLVVDLPVSRRRTPADGGHRSTLFSRALNTPDSIPAYVVFYPTPDGTDSATTSTTPTSEVPMVMEAHSLVALGPMVNGHDGVSHGGLVVALLDEIMGQLLDANRARGARPRGGAMTGYLNTRFERPVLTGSVEAPGVVWLTARVVRYEGRKYWLEAEARDEGRVVLARADALFIELKERL